MGRRIARRSTKSSPSPSLPDLFDLHAAGICAPDDLLEGFDHLLCRYVDVARRRYQGIMYRQHAETMFIRGGDGGKDHVAVTSHETDAPIREEGVADRFVTTLDRNKQPVGFLHGDPGAVSQGVHR